MAHEVYSLKNISLHIDDSAHSRQTRFHYYYFFFCSVLIVFIRPEAEPSVKHMTHFSLFSDYVCQECADFTVVIHSSVRNNSFIKCLQFPLKQDKGAHIFPISRLTSLHAGLLWSTLTCIVSSLRLNLRDPSLTAELFAAICLFSAQACRRTMVPMLATLTLACLGIKTAIVHIFFYIQLQNVSKCVHALGLGQTCSVA